MIRYIKTKDFGRVIEKIVREYQSINQAQGTLYKVEVYSDGVRELEGVKFDKDKFIEDIKQNRFKVFIFRNYFPFYIDEIVHIFEKYIFRYKVVNFRIYFVGYDIEELQKIDNYVEIVEDYYPTQDEIDQDLFVEGLTFAEMLKIKIFNLEKDKYREKILKKSGGILEILKPHEVDLAIGLEEVIELIRKMKGRGKGTLLLGVPGTGKTLIAKNISQSDVVVKFSFSAIYSKYVGESERKLRETIQIIEQFGDCFLFIDEFEKALASGSANTDSGVSKRLLGEFLSWLEDRNRKQYIIATANNISYLPLELVRPGRWDFIFGIIPPPRKVREKIIEYYSKKYSIEFDSSLLEIKNITPADISNLYRIGSVIGLDKAKKYVKLTYQISDNFQELIKQIKKYSTLIWDDEEE